MKFPLALLKKKHFCVSNMDLDQPHRRFNPLTGEWVLVSPHRTKRPWTGQQEANNHERRPSHDPNCYLCSGNTRANGEVNPTYRSTHVFENDFAALLKKEGEAIPIQDPLFQAEAVSGTCRVICFSPDHSLSLAEMSPLEIRKVVDIWVDQTEELGQKYKWVQLFENKGAVMGCSNPHPHGQVWASDFLPEIPKKEDQSQKKYFEKHKTPLLCDYLSKELKTPFEAPESRCVVENEDWVVVVPFWALWPYETLLLPKRKVSRITELTETEKKSLSECLKELLAKYDNLFQTSFPYSMGWHQAPFEEGAEDYWQLHAHFFPPLLRSASVKKFMVGYEMLGEPQRDITAEGAALALRKLSNTHYLTTQQPAK